MTGTFSVPPDVVLNVRKRWPHIGDDWVSEVESDIHVLCLRYRATLLTVLPARYGFVVAAGSAYGGLVFRASPDPNAAVQAQVALTLARLRVAPAVHDILRGTACTWTILDQVQPGRPLADEHPEPRQLLTSLTTPLLAIARQPAPVLGMRPIADWLRPRLTSHDLADSDPGTKAADDHVRRSALQALDALAVSTAGALCHGDLSLRNVLRHQQSGWMFIDPRGVSGEVEYDIAVLGTKVTRQWPHISLTEPLADAVGVDRHRVQLWASVATAARV